MCHEVKSREQFTLARGNKGGLDYYCRECKRKKFSSLPPRKAASQWKHTLRTKYGLSVEDVWRMLIEQSGRCAICTTELYDPLVDHCHTTGVVRGLLCQRCNVMLGAIERDGFVEAARAYLAEAGRGAKALVAA